MLEKIFEIYKTVELDGGLVANMGCNGHQHAVWVCKMSKQKDLFGANTISKSIIGECDKNNCQTPDNRFNDFSFSTD